MDSKWIGVGLIGVLAVTCVVVFIVMPLLSRRGRASVRIMEIERRWRKRREYEEERRSLDEEIKDNRRRMKCERVNAEELERRETLKDVFSYVRIGGYGASYRYDYYPLNKYSNRDINSLQEVARRAVWSFKDGNFRIGVNIICDFIDGNYTVEQRRNLVLCVIPASTEHKNDIRYKELCRMVAERTAVRNGFRYISMMEDRDNSRREKGKDTLEYLVFSPLVYGKDILLFDDMSTTGASFIQAADVMMIMGARSVYGLFIGKTVSKYTKE